MVDKPTRQLACRGSRKLLDYPRLGILPFPNRIPVRKVRLVPGSKEEGDKITF